jgi:hypothetical protein
MSIVPRLTYYSTARLCSVLQVPHAVMNRLFPDELIVPGIAHPSE